MSERPGHPAPRSRRGRSARSRRSPARGSTARRRSSCRRRQSRQGRRGTRRASRRRSPRSAETAPVGKSRDGPEERRAAERGRGKDLDRVQPSRERARPRGVTIPGKTAARAPRGDNARRPSPSHREPRPRPRRRAPPPAPPPPAPPTSPPPRPERGRRRLCPEGDLEGGDASRQQGRAEVGDDGGVVERHDRQHPRPCERREHRLLAHAPNGAHRPSQPPSTGRTMPST